MSRYRDLSASDMGQYQLCQAWVGFAPVACQIAARDTIQFVKQGQYLQVYFFSILSIGDLMVEGQEKLMQMFYTIHDLLTPIIQVSLDKLMSDRRLEVSQHVQADEESVSRISFFKRRRRGLRIVNRLCFE